MPKNKSAVALGNITKKRHGPDYYQEIGRKGGRPRQYPACPKYRSHVFNPRTGRCACGFVKPTEEGKNVS